MQRICPIGYFSGMTGIVIVVVAMLSGCQNSATAPPDEPEPFVSPLTEFIGLDWSQRSVEENQRLVADIEAQRQDLISGCMHDAGFEYIPNPSPILVGGIRTGADYRPNDRDWVTQWGYGIVDSPSGSVAQHLDMDEWNATDPNSALLDEMSPQEQSAWRDAFNGIAPIDVVDGVAIFPEDMTVEELGCSRWAQNQVPFVAPGQELLFTDEFAPLWDSIVQMQTTLNDSPEMLAVDQDWSNCMANAGFVGLRKPALAQAQVEIAWSQIPAEQRTGTDRAAELQEQEISLALADLDCRASTSYFERRNAITLATETQFVEDHRADLNALLSAREQRELN